MLVEQTARCPVDFPSTLGLVAAIFTIVGEGIVIVTAGIRVTRRSGLQVTALFLGAGIGAVLTVLNVVSPDPSVGVWAYVIVVATAVMAGVCLAQGVWLLRIRRGEDQFDRFLEQHGAGFKRRKWR